MRNRYRERRSNEFSTDEARWLNRQGRVPELRRRMGEFDLEQTAKALGDRAAIGDAVSHYRRRLHPATAICFCCTIQHAEQLACTAKIR